MGVHFLDYVWPTVLSDEEVIMEEDAREEAEAGQVEGGYYYRRLLDTDECATGYYAQSGDIPGNGIGGLQQVSNCNECSQLCSDNGNCLSYECSPTELKCNFNTGANPTADTYKDYVFCTKNNIRTEESCSKSITATSEEHCGQTLEYYCEDGYFEEEGKCRKWVFLPFPVKIFGDMLHRDIPRTCTFKVERIDCPCCSRASEPCDCPHELLKRNTLPWERQCNTYFDKQTCASTDTDWIHSQLSDFLQS